jgi:hypothetical protein
MRKIGAIAIAFGLLFDLVEHSMGVPVPRSASSTGFSIGEHTAHLIVLAGMVAVLVGVIVDGMRVAGRIDRPQGRASDAIR